LHRVDTQVVCRRGHAFDLARQGYLNLTVGSARHGSADTSTMVSAREQFLAAGHYRPIADELAASDSRRAPRGTPLPHLAGSWSTWPVALVTTSPQCSMLFRIGMGSALTSPRRHYGARPERTPEPPPSVLTYGGGFHSRADRPA